MLTEASAAADFCCRFLLQRRQLQEQHMSRKTRVVTIRKAGNTTTASGGTAIVPPAERNLAFAAASSSLLPPSKLPVGTLSETASSSAAHREGPMRPKIPETGNSSVLRPDVEDGAVDQEAGTPSSLNNVDCSLSSSSCQPEIDLTGSSSTTLASSYTKDTTDSLASTTVVSVTSAPPMVCISQDQVDRFRAVLKEILLERCRSSNWDPHYPMQGNAYRAVSYFAPACHMDQALVRAAEEAGLGAGVLRQCFPTDLVIWVDPGTVAYRVGDNGTTIHLVHEGRIVSPTATQPLSESYGTNSTPVRVSASTVTSNRLQLQSAAPALSVFPVSSSLPGVYASQAPQQFQQSQAHSLAVNPYTLTRCAVSVPALHASQQVPTWSASRVPYQYSKQAPLAMPAQAVASYSGSQRPITMIAPQLMSAPSAHVSHQPQQHPAGIVIQPQPVAVKITNPPDMPHQTVSKRPAYIMAN